MNPQDALDIAIPKSHPATTRALCRIDSAILAATDHETKECLALLRLMVSDADLGLYEHLAKNDPKMWNHATFNGVRTWVARLKEFAR